MSDSDFDPASRQEYQKEIYELAIQVLEQAIDYDSDLDEVLHETIDGHTWVVHTASSQAVLILSNNDGYAAEELGADAIVSDGCLQWSVMAFYAMQADVWEALDDLDADCCGDDDDDLPAALAEAKGLWEGND